MAHVTVTCKSCQRNFPSPMQVGSKEAFETLGFERNRIQCPLCSQENAYNKEDLTYTD